MSITVMQMKGFEIILLKFFYHFLFLKDARYFKQFIKKTNSKTDRHGYQAEYILTPLL